MDAIILLQIIQYNYAWVLKILGKRKKLKEYWDFKIDEEAALGIRD